MKRSVGAHDRDGLIERDRDAWRNNKRTLNISPHRIRVMKNNRCGDILDTSTIRCYCDVRPPDPFSFVLRSRRHWRREKVAAARARQPPRLRDVPPDVRLRPTIARVGRNGWQARISRGESYWRAPPVVERQRNSRCVALRQRLPVGNCFECDRRRRIGWRYRTVLYEKLRRIESGKNRFLFLSRRRRDP